MNIKEKIEVYLHLRKRKEEIVAENKAALAAKVGPIERAMDAIEDAVRGKLQADGQESVKTEAGTAFLTHQRKYSMDDRYLFGQFIVDKINSGVPVKDMMAFFGKSIIKEAATDFIEKTGALPDGIGVETRLVVQFRSPTGSTKNKGESDE